MLDKFKDELVKVVQAATEVDDATMAEYFPERG